MSVPNHQLRGRFTAASIGPSTTMENFPMKHLLMIMTMGFALAVSVAAVTAVNGLARDAAAQLENVQ